MRRVNLSLPVPAWATRRRSVGALIGLAVAAVLLVAGCSSPPTQQQQDAARSQQGVERLVANQPIAVGNYSPSRDTLNAWVRAWESAPGKRAYTYIYMQGSLVGYYVLTGPPVSYAIGGTEPYRTECNSVACFQVPNPGQDGTFANQGSGQFQWYGQDATTKRMLEFGGAGVTYLLSDRPLPVPAPPLGDTR